MVCSGGMDDKHPDSKLIEALGGAAEVARKLGLNDKGGTQVVHNWTTRGIPAVWRLRRPDLFPYAQAPDPQPVERAA